MWLCEFIRFINMWLMRVDVVLCGFTWIDVGSGGF